MYGERRSHHLSIDFTPYDAESDTSSEALLQPELPLGVARKVSFMGIPVTKNRYIHSTTKCRHITVLQNFETYSYPQSFASEPDT